MKNLKHTMAAAMIGGMMVGGLGTAALLTSMHPGRAFADEERHPEIRAALADLTSARGHLEKGEHDFDGQRQAALDATDAAIELCKNALHVDRH